MSFNIPGQWGDEAQGRRGKKKLWVAGYELKPQRGLISIDEIIASPSTSARKKVSINI
jgi:hypothetical protein